MQTNNNAQESALRGVGEEHEISCYRKCRYYSEVQQHMHCGREPCLSCEGEGKEIAEAGESGQKPGNNSGSSRPSGYVIPYLSSASQEYYVGNESPNEQANGQ